MLERLRQTLQPVLGPDANWDRLRGQVAFETVAPGTILQAAGEVVRDTLLVECGVLEVETPGEPPRWAPPGAILSLATSLLEAPSASTITAVRHARVGRLPARALWELGEGIPSTTAGTAALRLSQLAQVQDSGVSTLPPDPLVIACVLEGLDAEREAAVAELLEQAVARLGGAHAERMSATPADPAIAIADELASHEAGHKVLVYIIGADAGQRGAAVTAHADRVLLVQPILSSADPSPARNVACDGSPRRHTEVAYVASGAQSTSESTRRMRAPAHIRRAHHLAELSATRLELLLTELRQEAREHEALRHFEVFAELAPSELVWVQRHLHWERVDGGSLLVQQGHVADALWLLRAGKLEVLREANGSQRHLASLGPGSVVGEAAVLAGTPHTESVRAPRDSTVARLDRDVVTSLMERSVGFARVMARVVARESTSRSFGESDPGVHKGRTIAVIPLAPPERVRRFVSDLAAMMQGEGSDTTIVDTERLDSALGASASTTRRGDVGDAEIIAWLNRLEEQHETVVLVCGAEFDSWMRRAMRQGDAVLFVADATDAPAPRPVEVAIFGGMPGATGAHATGGGDAAPSFAGERHLILLQPAGITEATGTAAWLAERREHKHHHVRAGSREDLARLARRLTGRAVALALSGAASRAPAHFGAVRAMIEHGLPIDIMSGSSSGAGVAALVAMGFPYDVALAHALSIISKGIPTLRQFQPPITALTSGAQAGEALKSVYGNRQLEDQLIPTIVTAVDIRRHRLVLLTRGPIWKLLRASGSLPLLWPPVWHDDDLLVDGAILNYLPMDVFGDEVASGLVIGSNLEISSKPGAPAFERSMRYGAVLSGWRVLGRRLIGRKHPRPPGVVEILYHAMAIPSFHQQAAMERLAERDNVCILTPPLGSFGLFGANAEIGRKLEREAWEYARGALGDVAARWKGGRAGR